MKIFTKLFFIASLLFVTNNSKAQFFGSLKYPYALDSLIYEQYDLSTSLWEIDNIQKYVLNPDKTPSQVKLYQGNQFIAVVDYSYANNLLIGYELKFNFAGTLLSLTRVTFSYDANGNLINVLTEEKSDPFATVFDPSSRTILSYNGQNKLTTQIEDEWSTNVNPAAWVHSSKTNFTYDGTGNNISSIDSNWNTNSNIYQFYLKSTNTFDANNKLTETIRTDAGNTPTARDRFIYNSAGYLTEEITEAYLQGVYEITSKDSTVYNNDNLITSEFQYSTDFGVTKTFYLSDRMNAAGNAVGFNTPSFSKLNVKIFPNPASDKINILLPSSANAEIEIYSIKGELISKSNTSLMSSSIDVSDLSNGIYIMKVKQKDAIKEQKIIINK